MTEKRDTRALVVDFSDESLYNSVYIPILHDSRRYVHLMGGGGSWKSVFEAQKEVIESFKPGNRCLCVRKVKDTHRDSCYAQIVEVINLWGLESQFDLTTSPLYIKNKLTGSDFIFRGLDDPEKIKSVVWVTRVWCEEATELTKADFNQIDLRLRWHKNLQITLTYNPVDKDHWLNTDFWTPGENADTRLLHTTYKDNRWAWPQYEKVMERLREQDPNMYAIYALWIWGNKVEGLVFEFEIIPEVPEWAKKLWHGQDFWYTHDPSACGTVYEWNDALVLDELFYLTGLTNPDIVTQYKLQGVLLSDLIVADSSEPKSIEEIYRAGYDIHGVKKWPDSINFGIQIMRQRKIYVTQRSVNLIKELRNYCWAKDRTGKVLNKPIDAFNHIIDAIRYLLMHIYWEQESSPNILFL